MSWCRNSLKYVKQWVLFFYACLIICFNFLFQKVEEILKNLSLEAYLVELSQSACSLAACWFTRYEVHFIYELLMLIVECQPSSAVLSIVHQAALVAVNVVSQGDEYIAARLLIRIVFHPTCVQ